jgi:outer membrane autotransporter protein
MSTMNARHIRLVAAVSSALTTCFLWVGSALAQTQPDTITVPGSASALVFNELFNVGGVGDRTDGNFQGSTGCGGTAASLGLGGAGGQALTNVLDYESGQQNADLAEARVNRNGARDLWRFCDNLYEQGGAWTTFYISPDDERLQSAGLAPDELFAQIDQAAMITRAQVRSVGSRATQLRLAALGYDREAIYAGNGAVSIDVDGGSFDLDLARGLNASGDPVDEGVSGSRLSIWANLRRVDIEAGTTPAEIGSNTDGYGAVVGFDYRVGNSFFTGVSVGLTQLDSDFERIAGTPTGTSSVDNTALQFVWSYFPNDHLYLNGVIGLSNLSFDNTKYVPTFDMGQAGADAFAPLDSSPDGTTKFMNISLGYDVRGDAVTFSPYLRLEYLKTEVDGFTERPRPGGDGTLALTLDAQHNTSFTGTIGAQLAFPRSTESGIWTPYLRAELVKEFKNQSDTLRGFLTIIPAASFALAPDATDERYAFAGVGVSGQLRNGWAMFFDYDSLSGYEALDSWQATLGFRKEL